MEPNLGPFSFYVEAFKEIGTCRSGSFTMGPIPFTAIVEYFKVFNVQDDFEDFHYLIRRMDNALLKAESDKERAKSSVKEANGTGKTAKGNSNKGGRR